MPFSQKGRNTLKYRLTEGTKNVLSRRTLKIKSSRNKKVAMLPQVTTSYLFLKTKRAVSFVFLKKAFISIETAVCLTLFMMAILSVLSFGTVMNQKMKLEPALRNTASKIAQDYSVYNYIAEDKTDFISEYLVKGVGIVAAKQLFMDELGKERLDNSLIEGGNSGISFLYSDIVDDEGYVDIIITYKMDLPFKLIPVPEIKMTQRCRIHSWAGVEVFGDGNEDEEYVYVTKNGSVYHVSLSCKHLNIQITKINKSEIGSVRNNSGGKYYACEICCQDDDESIYYITKSGTAYHSSKDCPSITRDVRKVSITECAGMPVCKSCGG